eukprot:gnl/TRDRNA2_/TRDRNA2_175938_c6_seq6.p1 gnl/TRDRNA2_/TRDRNA2_175938_c6~~gnl/TRDRNA2_/TRDRNA2_175938_c6_seq6.p1  ORF type:complete len:1830 (+),score=285.34 gnl/TRDRNA2_/TRDRNA2_175938_c6_seq6:718-5490(+)
MAPRDALAEVVGEKPTSAQKNELFPMVCSRLLTAVLDYVELRGAQAGGCNLFLGQSGGRVVGQRSRSVKTKRGILATEMFGKYRRELGKFNWKCTLTGKPLQPLPEVLIQGHSRFGTSSAPAENETHPHRWSGEHDEIVWSRDVNTGKWTHAKKLVCVTITHNGDFDAYQLYDEMVGNGQLGLWLTRVLHICNTARGDSPKLAGIMDVLITQGQWMSSARWAFVFTVMQHEHEVFGWDVPSESAPKNMPSPDVLQELGKVFHGCFLDATSSNEKFEPTDDASVAKLVEKAVSCFQKKQHANGSPISGGAVNMIQKFSVEGDKLKNFCANAVKAFFENDILSSVQTFFTRAAGTFGISVTCTLWPTLIVLGAKGQPISCGIDPERPLAFWSSEPTAIGVAWPVEKKAAKRAAAVRYDLDDAMGEALELRLFGKGTGNKHVNAMKSGPGALPGRLKDANYFVMPGCDGSEERDHILLTRGTSLPNKHSGEPIMQTVAGMTKRWVKLRAPPAANSAWSKGLDPIEKDILDIPALLKDVEASFADEKALNYISCHTFSLHLAKLLTREQRSQDIDVLVYGMENSLWLGQQFAADLRRIFPRLKITAMSSNWILGMLQQGQGHIEMLNFSMSRRIFRLSPGAICLAISQSGTTYPTVWASRLLARLPMDKHIFAMSGLFDTVLANSIGQDLSQPTFGGKLFSTMSNIRFAEPSTAATIAMMHSLSWILLVTARTVVQSGEIALRQNASKDSIANRQSQVPMCELRMTEINDFERLICSLGPNAAKICGTDHVHNDVPSKVSQDLRVCGDYIAGHLLEGWYTLATGAAYVIVTVTLGIPVLTTIWTHVSEAALSDVQDDMVAQMTAVSYAVAYSDSIIYVFLGAIICSVIRWWQGRRLFTRYTSRCLVIVDSTANYKLLRAYASKLRSLAFRFTTFTVMGQNPGDHFVHEMTHLTTSEVMILMGRPDGRVGTLAASEAAMYMSLQQAKFVASRSHTGIEAITVGHNPWAKKSIAVQDVVVPTEHRPRFLSQQLFGTIDGPHPPGEVLTKVAGFAEGKSEQGAQGDISQMMVLPFPKIEMKELKEKMGNQAEVSTAEARALIEGCLIEQSDALAINPNCATSITDELLPMSDQDPQTKTSTVSLFAPASSVGKAQPGRPELKRANSRDSDSLVVKGLPNNLASKQRGHTASELMAKLRGLKMQQIIMRKQADKIRDDIREKVRNNAGRDREKQALQECFAAWASETREAKKKRHDQVQVDRSFLAHALDQGLIMSRSTKRTSMKEEEEKKPDAPTLEWRIEEEFRVRRYAMNEKSKQQLVNPEVIFRAWWHYYKFCAAKNEAEAAGRRRKDSKGTGTPSEPSTPLSPMSMPLSPGRKRGERSEAFFRQTSGSTAGGFTRQESGNSAGAPTSPKSFLPMSSWDSTEVINIIDPVVPRLSGDQAEANQVTSVGSGFVGQVANKELLAELCLIESLYETRVAAAERLLSFFVILYHAVRPLSRLWGLHFDMDRSESRLRVASTPAPVPFIEKLSTTTLASTKGPTEERFEGTAHLQISEGAGGQSMGVPDVKGRPLGVFDVQVDIKLGANDDIPDAMVGL